MNNDYKDFFNVNSQNLIMSIVIIIIIIIILVYSSNQTTLQTKNCEKIKTTFMKDYLPATSVLAFPNRTRMTDVYIKTAYNCCCSGKFKNDYVDICALQNCARYGVRALDFQVFKLNGKPIIAASTVNEIKYKEIYNYLYFNDTMLEVYNSFITNTTLTNSTEPLFLIFRVYSKAKDTYDQMFTSLNNIFGSGQQSGNSNMIYITSDLPNTKIKTLMNKVIILVEYSCIGKSYETECETSFKNSSLSKITSLNLNGLSGKVYRESEILLNKNSLNDFTVWFTQHSSELNIIYPNTQTNSHNYDFTLSGLNTGTSFIGLNFQTNDTNLTRLNTADVVDTNGKVTIVKGLGNKAFKLKPLVVGVTNDTSELITDFKNNVNSGNNILKRLANINMTPPSII
uniref:PI-PLC Y-box domain-containing protein n=1 Tax=viral metagenome TaxID=1070528 RepID=A0A6C0JK61_9ZZZZ